MSFSPVTVAKLQAELVARDEHIASQETLIAAREAAIVARDAQIASQDTLIAEQSAKLAAQRNLLALMEEQLRLAKVQRFGQRSEKHPDQGELFDEAELAVAIEVLDAQLPEATPGKTPRKKPRDGFSDSLPRVRIELTLSEADKAGASSTFFSKIKEELDIIPAQARVLEYWQEKAVFENDAAETQIKTAPQPVHPLGKCQASVALLAYVLVSKYADALPLYRQEKILQRYGAEFSRTTLANWIIRLAEVFAPLLQRLREHQMQADYLQADETRLQVLKETGRVARSDKWMWLVRGGPPQQPVVLFHYDPSRGEDVPVRLLEGYHGVLQVDGYAGYGKACRENGLTRIGCWDHARRKFVEADKAAPKKKRTAPTKAAVALGQIAKLYRIEKAIQDLPAQEKTTQRQQQSRPLLMELQHWLQTNQPKVPKDSLTGKAIAYTLNQWETLTAYCDHGQVPISNALAENAIRPFAVGRRNWLFADTPRGAHASAACFSLIETAKANGQEPMAYIRYVLARIATADTPDKLDQLLPWNADLKA